MSIKKLFGRVSVSNLQNGILQVVIDAPYIFDGMTANLTVRCPIIMIWPNEYSSLNEFFPMGGKHFFTTFHDVQASFGKKGCRLPIMQSDFLILIGIFVKSLW